MSYNPFASYNVDIPSCHRESVLKFCRTGGNRQTREYAPFERQVDFWFMSFILAVNKQLEPVKESDTYNATQASIFSTNPERVSFLQLCVLGLTEDMEMLIDTRKLFDYCIEMANAGMPYLIQILQDPDDSPLWVLMDKLEELSG